MQVKKNPNYVDEQQQIHMKNVKMKLDQAFNFLNSVNAKLTGLSISLEKIVSTTNVLNPSQHH
jgi:hypothetical protein